MRKDERAPNEMGEIEMGDTRASTFSEKLLIATSNPGKIKEISQALEDLDLEIITLKDLPPIKTPEETGKSFLENALFKAKYYAEKTGLLSLADDSGLEVLALKGAPGIYSARFAGPKATDEENYQKLLNLMKDIPYEKRDARFICAMVCYHPSGKYIYSIGTWEGKVSYQPKGTLGFGYDPIFLVREFNYEKTAAELPLEVKNTLSHRAKALNALKEQLKDFLKGLLK